MQTNDQSNYHSFTRFSSTYTNIWNYGKEVWCNLEGRYMHIIADLSDLAGQGYEMILCSVGIMGTQYVRAQTFPETVEIQSENFTTLTIQNIYSTISIGN